MPATIVAAVACMGWDGTVDPSVARIEDTADGVPYRVTRVRDLRVFRRGVGAPWEHTLYAGDPQDRTLTSRVIGRRSALSRPRSDRRSRLGNLFLPEGRTVPALVADAVTSGFRQAGRHTLDPDTLDPQREPLPGERPIRVDIEGFWGRQQSALDVVRFETWIQIRLEAPDTPLGDGGFVCAFALVTSGGPSAAVWQRSYEKGLADLSRRVARAVTKGPPPYCVSP